MLGTEMFVWTAGRPVLAGVLLGGCTSQSLADPGPQTWSSRLSCTGLTTAEGHAAERAADGTPTPELEAATNRVKLLASLELIGFVVIFTCMILMGFDL